MHCCDWLAGTLCPQVTPSFSPGPTRRRQLLAAGDSSMAVPTLIGPFSEGVTQEQADVALGGLAINVGTLFTSEFKRNFGVLTVRRRTAGGGNQAVACLRLV